MLQDNMFPLAVAFCLATAAAHADAEDWPMWRHDAARSAASAEELAGRLHLQWVRELPRLRRAWPDQRKMPFDAQYEPIVMGQLVFIGSSWTDSVTAYSMATGEEKWVFHADGPVRFAPAGYRDKIYFVSDDGYLYCLRAADGTLMWKLRGGPSDRKILGNGRLISTWPARGGPVIADGTVYFTAGIWPFMGVFVHAVDAETGEVAWTNDGEGSRYQKQPHNTYAFAGVAPQGALVVSGDKLLIPGSRSVPACYDRWTGELLHFRLAAKTGGAFRRGGSEVSAAAVAFFNEGAAYSLKTGTSLGDLEGPLPVVDNHVLFQYRPSEKRYVAYDLTDVTVQESEETGIDRYGNPSLARTAKWQPQVLWSCQRDAQGPFIKAGSRLYAVKGSKISAIDVPPPAERPNVSWETTVEGTPVRLVAADERLLVVTLEGRVYCYGAQPTEPKTHSCPLAELPQDEQHRAQAKQILAATGVRDGYCVVWGVGTGRLIGELLQQSNLHIIAVDPDAGRVDAVRKKFVSAGLYGRRVSVHVGDAISFLLPPYLASLMVAPDPAAAGVHLDRQTLESLFSALRPYGGVACLDLSKAKRDELAQLVARSELAQSHVSKAGRLTMLSRQGALPGSANWTHEHADASNSRCSKDRRVKAPLGILWFGGPTHSAILPRHGHGPAPQVIDGRLFIEGRDLLRAIDIYTGRLLWERPMEAFGKLYSHTEHHPGANGVGTNYVSTHDGIYAIYERACLRLDPGSGRTISEFKLPTPAGASESPDWNYINVYGDFLIGGTDKQVKRSGYWTHCDQLWVIHRHSGKVLWTVEADARFRNNTICAGGGRLYLIDHIAPEELKRLLRRGQTPEVTPRLRVFDLRDGKPLWNNEKNVFGTMLSYSAEHDVLVESGSPWRDHLEDEASGIRVYRAADASVLWYNKDYSGPLSLRGDQVLMFQYRGPEYVMHDPATGKPIMRKDSGTGEMVPLVRNRPATNTACHVLTGKPVMREEPLTGQPVPWTWARTYGCGFPQASEHLILFRSGAAGYYDLAGDGGTGNFGGFKSGCTNNLIVAGGVLTAPEYTRTCTCSYQLQTSLALVHTPETEIWTRFRLSLGPDAGKADLKHVALNLGAPGHRRAPGGRLWLNENGPAFVENNPTKVESFDKFWQVEFDKGGYYNGHSSKITGDGLKWVAASGCRGIARLELDLKRKQPARYTVRLHFCDPDNDQSGRRTFAVKLQGQPALAALDIAGETGGRNRPLVKEFSGVQVDDKLVVAFTAAKSAGDDPAKLPLLCGIELVQEQ